MKGLTDDVRSKMDEMLNGLRFKRCDLINAVFREITIEQGRRLVQEAKAPALQARKHRPKTYMTRAVGKISRGWSKYGFGTMETGRWYLVKVDSSSASLDMPIQSARKHAERWGFSYQYERRPDLGGVRIKFEEE